jgi:hypothetical protein
VKKSHIGGSAALTCVCQWAGGRLRTPGDPRQGRSKAGPRPVQGRSPSGLAPGLDRPWSALSPVGDLNTEGYKTPTKHSVGSQAGDGAWDRSPLLGLAQISVARAAPFNRPGQAFIGNANVAQCGANCH